MDRRDFLKCTSAATLAVGTAAATAATAAKAADDAEALAAPALVPARRTLRMLSQWPDAVTGPGDQVRRFAKRIEAASDNSWVIEFADKPVAGVDAFKAVMTGEADLYVGHEHAQRGLHPAFSYFAGLPCRTGMSIDRHNAWLMTAGGQELWDDLAAEFNMKGLLIGHSGRSHGLFTRQPMQARSSFKGKRIATDGIAADVLSALGATAVTDLDCAWQDLYAIPGLDGIDALGLYSHAPRQSQRLERAHGKAHWINAPLNDSGYAYTLGLRRSVWDGLPNSQRIMLQALSSEQLAASRAELCAESICRMQNARSIPLPANQHPETASELHAIKRTAHQLTRIAETIVADLAGHDGHARRINASYMAIRGTHAAAPVA